MILNIGHDISERKRVQEKLIFHDSLLSSVHDAIIAQDEYSNITYWNKIAEEMFGWTEDEVIGKNFTKILQRKAKNLSQEMDIRKMLNDGEYSGEEFYRRKNGMYIPTDVLATTIKDEKGNIKGLLASIRDITDYKKAEEEILNHQKVLGAINRVFQEYLKTDTVNEIVQKCLELAQNLTASEFGFFGEINENGRLDDRALSPPVWDVCETQNAHERLRNMEIVSYWGRTIKEGEITNRQ